MPYQGYYYYYPNYQMIPYQYEQPFFAEEGWGDYVEDMYDDLQDDYSIYRQFPSGPPPKQVPQVTPGLTAVDPGAIRRCRYRFVYIWLENGRSFWAWLTFVGRRSIAGYRWIRNRWVYFGTDLRNISDFYCL